MHSYKRMFYLCTWLVAKLPISCKLYPDKEPMVSRAAATDCSRHPGAQRILEKAVTVDLSHHQQAEI